MTAARFRIGAGTQSDSAVRGPASAEWSSVPVNAHGQTAPPALPTIAETVQSSQSSRSRRDGSRRTNGPGHPPGSQAYLEYARHNCLTCGTYFSDRSDLFEHLEARQHGVDFWTGNPESYTRPQVWRDIDRYGWNPLLPTLEGIRGKVMDQ